MRSVIFRFESIHHFAGHLEQGHDEQELVLPPCESFREGEWVLAHFCIGDESTSVAACVMDRGAGSKLVFEERDWDHLRSFIHEDSRASIPPPSVPSDRNSCVENIPPNTRVLLVDDDRDLQEVLCALLCHAGYEACSASSAEQALDLLRNSHFDLLVLDWHLPGMTGLQLCQRLRQAGEQLPILFLTGHATDADVMAAFRAGADDFVPKPFRAPELSARVLGLLRRSHVPHQASSAS